MPINDIIMLFVQEIFKVEHFQIIISRKNLLSGKPVADPFVIAKAKVIDGTVVTNESYKPHGAKIPNICEYFNVKCANLEKFMEIGIGVFSFYFIPSFFLININNFLTLTDCFHIYYPFEFIQIRNRPVTGKVFAYISASLPVR